MKKNILTEYQEFTKKCNVCSEYYQEVHLIAGLAAETGEVCALVQKYYRAEPENRVKFTEDMRLELGDVLWHVSELARLYDLTLEEILKSNIHKLEQRYKLQLANRK